MSPVKGEGMRGLAVFISDIRNCKSKEAEIKRINKELANIRSKFKGDKTLDGYQKKKYICKLLFIFLLGHDIDFGHMEAVNLLSSNRYSEKQIGYLFILVLMNQDNELMRLVIQSVKNDLSSRNPVHVNLALQCIANIGSPEFAEAFGPVVPKLLVTADTIDTVKQSAALCLLRLLKTQPTSVPLSEWTSRIIQLLNDQHLGVVTSAASLIETLVKMNPEEYKGCVPLAISRLSRIVNASFSDMLQDYTYYFVPAPWLSVKLIRLLQNYPPPEEASVRARLNECLETVLNKAQEPSKSKKVQHSNAKNAVLFEVISLILHMDRLGANIDPGLIVRACNQLGQFFQHKETNLRYMALDGMRLLAASECSRDAVKKYQETVITALRGERDVSVRQRAVDLLYAMCDQTNVSVIVGEMLAHLETADYSVREEMVLKVAILAEKYATDYSWYVDVVLNLIRVAGDYVSDEVWFRVVQIVINRDDVQGYAAQTVFQALQAPACHENMVKVAGYILGEFGNLIAGDARSAPIQQFQLLHSKYHLCAASTRALLLTAYVKFINLFPEIRSEIQNVLSTDSNIRSSDVELQQRSVEYLHMSRRVTPEVLATVLDEMPPFPERESSILAMLKKKKPQLSENGTFRNNAPSPSVATKRSSGVPAAANSTTVPQLQPTLANTNTLVELSNGNESPPKTNGNLAASPPLIGGQFMSNEEAIKRFALKHNGILFENELLQVGVKAEYRAAHGRITLFYGNKSTCQLEGYTTQFLSQPHKLLVQAQPVDSVIAAGSQVQQLISVECLEEFKDPPTLNIRFLHAGAPQSCKLVLPVFVNKFFQPTVMNGEAFFSRWKNLCAPQQESQKIFKAKFSIDTEISRGKLSSFGLEVLDKIDPNVNNFVCAGVVHTRLQQIGVLLRLEPNSEAKMYRLTVRSSKAGIAELIVDLLFEHF